MAELGGLHEARPQLPLAIQRENICVKQLNVEQKVLRDRAAQVGLYRGSAEEGFRATACV